MKKIVIYLMVIGLAVNIGLAGIALAQKRVIEEEIVLKDPTVSAPNKWVFGVSGEFWYVYRINYNLYWENTNFADYGVTTTMPGGNAFIGYDNWTLQFSYRAGDTDIDIHSHWTPTNSCDIIEEQEHKEYEVTLRYLIRGWGSKHFVPYVLGGYNSTSIDIVKTILTPGWTFTSTGTPVIHEERDYKSWILGIGAVVPFNRHVGMRCDGRLLFTDYETTNDEVPFLPPSGSGVGGVGVLTGYWNIVKGFNFQIGAKTQYLYAGEKMERDFKVGCFAMLGYSFKF